MNKHKTHDTPKDEDSDFELFVNAVKAQPEYTDFDSEIAPDAIKNIAKQFAAAVRNAAIASLEKQLPECQALLKVKDDALRFYANPEVYKPDFRGIVPDNTFIAQKTLAQTSGTEALDKLIAEAEQRRYDKCIAEQHTMKGLK